MSAESVNLVMSLQISPESDVAALAGDQQAAAELIATVSRSYDSSMQCTMRFPGLAPVTYTGGLEGVSAAWRDWMRYWASYRIEVEDVIDAGDRVVVIHRAQCRRRRDTPECTLRRAAIWTVRDSRVVHVDFNLPCSEALAAVEPAPPA